MQTAIITRMFDAHAARATFFDATPREPALHPVHVASTGEVEPAHQFDAWRAQCGPFVEMRAPIDQGPGYRARCTTWKLGPFAFLSATAEGAHYRRTQAQVRRDAMDHWVIRLAHHGIFEMRTARGNTVIPAGLPFVFSLANAAEVVRNGSAWISLVVPRDTFPNLASVIDRRLHVPLDGSLGLMLGRYMQAMEAQLPDMTEAEVPRLVAATRAMIAACIMPSPETREAAGPLIEHARLERARQAIRQNLRSPTLTPKRLCRMVGMSRSQLYRLFEPMGGVARYIQAERLREAQRALADPDNRRDIHKVAEDLGFFDASAFSRTFRRAFGCTPSEVRAAALAGSGDIVLHRPPAQGPVRALTDLLRTLQ